MRTREDQSRTLAEQRFQPRDLRPIVFAVLQQRARDIETAGGNREPPILGFSQNGNAMLAQRSRAPSAAQLPGQPLQIGIFHRTGPSESAGRSAMPLGIDLERRPPSSCAN